jgi:adenosine kinase
MGRLGLRPVLVGAVGTDFADYRSWLDRAGVDTASVRVSESAHTARFLCTTDADMCQIASFYPGAMTEARDIELQPVVDRVGGLALVVISPNDPDAMLRHTDECRQRGLSFAADPSQQLARMSGDEIRQLIDGATYLLTNDYEKGLVEQKTGWTDAEVLARVGTRITTHGPKGVVVEQAGQPAVAVEAVAERRKADPTGVGDAFRAGFLTGQMRGLSIERSAQLGSLLATLALEVEGPQEYDVDRGIVLDRLGSNFGTPAASEIDAALWSD